MEEEIKTYLVIVVSQLPGNDDLTITGYNEECNSKELAISKTLLRLYECKMLKTRIILKIEAWKN